MRKTTSPKALLLGLITLALAWDPYPQDTIADRLEATAWVWVPAWIDCTDPDTGAPDRCLAGYVETFRSVLALPITATSASWEADLPSLAVAFLTVRAGRPPTPDGICWSDGRLEP